MILRLHDKGPDVEKLQRDLIALGYDVGPDGADGDYGANTRSAVLAFQLHYSDVDDDGVAGPQTLNKIAQALRTDQPPAAPPSAPLVYCNDETWKAFEKLVDVITQTPVRYGPGRGLFHDGKFVVTHGPGELGSNNWSNFLGHAYPSFHCTSWCNFFMGWLTRKNELYTSQGNIPDLFDLLTQGPELHEIPQENGTWTLRYRGYGDVCSLIKPDGSGAKRSGVANVVDARELYARRSSLPSFVVCGQSTKFGSAWRWWHHTLVYAVRDGRLYRIAADGYRDSAKGYNAQPMKWIEITDKNVGQLDGAVYRAYGVNTSDGSYGDQSKPIAEVTVEA